MSFITVICHSKSEKTAFFCQIAASWSRYLKTFNFVELEILHLEQLFFLFFFFNEDKAVLGRDVLINSLLSVELLPIAFLFSVKRTKAAELI